VLSIPHFGAPATIFPAPEATPRKFSADDAGRKGAWNRLISKIRQRTLIFPTSRRNAMAQEPLAKKGNYLHIYDFRVTPGKEEEFIELFEKFDYSDGNPMHKSWAQVKDGVLCRDTEDPGRFFLIAEWSDIEEHARIRKILANELKPEFIKYIEGGKFIPKYVEVVLSTPDEILQKAAG
jgi:hypothetical protein